MIALNSKFDFIPVSYTTT